MAVGGHEALSFDRIKQEQRAIYVLAAEGTHLDLLPGAAHLSEDEELHHTPQAQAVGGSGQHEQRAAAGEEDGQSLQVLADV